MTRKAFPSADNTWEAFLVHVHALWVHETLIY
jgi:hypothetical protein